jgi:hypothetical protein
MFALPRYDGAIVTKTTYLPEPSRITAGATTASASHQLELCLGQAFNEDQFAAIANPQGDEAHYHDCFLSMHIQLPK